MTAPNPPRTKPEALRDLDYLIRLNQRHERLYARMYGGIRFTELIGGGLALGVALCSAPANLAIAGGLLATVGMLSYAINPAQRLHDFTKARQQYTAIRTRHTTLDLDQIDSQRDAVEDPVYIEALRLPSFNDTMQSHGLDNAIRPLTRWQRLMHAIA